jgi:carboxyl-terminal processing protease
MGGSMRRFGGFAGVALLLAGAFALGLGLTRNNVEGAAPPEARDEPLRLVDEVRSELVTGYYRVVPPRVLARPRVRGIVSGLRDPYTEYLTPTEYASLRTRTSRGYGGVGLTVRPGSGGLVVKAAMPGPAREAGIRPGDRIVSIDGHRVRRLPFDRSLELIQGREGTKVRLTVRRPREGTLSVTVERREIELPAVRAKLVRAGGVKLAHVRVVSFRAAASENVARHAQALLRRGAKGIVLDVRDNPGGLLSEAVGTVSLFVESGVVCMTEGVNRGRDTYYVSGQAPLASVPLTVLVDSGSASAAEVVAAALADHGRARVVGRKTYGKAAVQSVRELSNGGALKLTTAIFRTPKGENLAARGLRPDVRALDDRATKRDEALERAAVVLGKQIAR